MCEQEGRSGQGELEQRTTGYQRVFVVYVVVVVVVVVVVAVVVVVVVDVVVLLCGTDNISAT